MTVGDSFVSIDLQDEKRQTEEASPAAGRTKTESGRCQRWGERYVWMAGIWTRVLESAFYRLGLAIAQRPKSTFALISLVFAVMVSGNALWYENTNNDAMYTPHGSQFAVDLKWIEKNFLKDKRYETVLIYGGNVLRASYVQYLYNLSIVVAAIEADTPERQNLADLCVRNGIELDSQCVVLTILDVWKDSESGKVDEKTIFQLTDDQVRRNISDRLDLEASGKLNESHFSVSNLLANVERDDEGNVASAAAINTVWILKNGGYVDDSGTVIDEVADGWEHAFIDAVIDESGYAKGGRVNTNGPVVAEKPDSLRLEALADFSFADGVLSLVSSSFDLLAAGSVFLLIFITSVLGKFNWLEQRIVLSLQGLTVIAMAIVTGYGGGFYLGFSFTGMHPMIPFMLLGVGVDNMFIIVKAVDNLPAREKPLPVPEKIALTMKSAGVSVTVTSVTDMAAFCISSTTSMPVLRSFCIFCALGVFFLYFFSITFFVLCLTLDEHRLAARKPSQCLSPKSKDWVPNSFSQIEFGNVVFGDLLPRIAFKPPVKVLVLAATLALFGGGLYGVTQLEADLDEVWYLDQSSYQARYAIKSKEFFPRDGERVEIYVGEIPYWKYPDQLTNIGKEIEANRYVKKGSYRFWHDGFVDFCGRLRSRPNCSEERDFKRTLLVYLTKRENRGFANDVKFSYDGSRVQLGRLPSNFSIDRLDVKSTRATFQHVILLNATSQTDALHSVRNNLERIVFAGQQFATPICYSEMYIHWEANEIMSKELVRNLGLTFLVVALIIFLLIPNLQMVFLTLVCVAFTVTDVAGYIYYMGLTIENVTSINLILSIGLAVDYCAHVTVSYICHKTGTREEKAERTLKEVGAAVFNGGFSTFLVLFMVVFSPSYVFQTFFKMFTMVVVFGLFHGLVFLPVALSLIGPQSSSGPLQDAEEADGRVNSAFDQNDAEVVVASKL